MSELLEAAGERGLAAHAIEDFRQSKLAGHAEYLRSRPIMRAGDISLYQDFDNDEDDDDELLGKKPNPLKKVAALGMLAAVIAATSGNFKSVSNASSFGRPDGGSGQALVPIDNYVVPAASSAPRFEPAIPPDSIRGFSYVNQTTCLGRPQL